MKALRKTRAAAGLALEDIPLPQLRSPDEVLVLRRELSAGLDDCKRALDALSEIRIPAYASTPLRCAALQPEGDSYFFGSRIRASDGSSIPVDRYREFTNEYVVPHSNARHSLHNGQPYLVGSLARLTLNGNRIANGLARQAWERLGPSIPCRNVVMNDIAQAIELVYSVERAAALVDALVVEGLRDERPTPFAVRAGQAAGAAEVPRGILFHRYEIDDDGRIAAADVITPTAQNLAHAEGQFRAAVHDAPDTSDEELKQRLQILARAYDPCISCSVHVLRMGE